MMQSAAPESWRAIVAGDKIVTANRETIEGCSKAAARARDTVRCTITIKREEVSMAGRPPCYFGLLFW